ncbi:MAG: DUF4252 domain-containing protein [Marinilabiliales bacterium]|nr:DUF4252 domain-containing protein [Marinilabiliales bacterium]
MVKSNGNTIREILVVASGENEAVIQICGNLTRDDVERLSVRSFGWTCTCLKCLRVQGNGNFGEETRTR